MGVLLSGLLIAGPVLHEYFDLDAPPSSQSAAGPDAPAGATGQPSALAAADEPGPHSPVAAEAGPHTSPDPDRYRLDSDTSRPERVGYDDPFTPSLAPFKRLHAYDSVNEQLELVVADRQRRALRVGSKPHLTDDQFFGDISVNLVSGKPARIPTVGPTTRVLGAKLLPAGDFQLSADSAENWFVTSSDSGARRLIVHLGIEREVFGSEFADVAWPRLQAALPQLPPIVYGAAAPVLESLGIAAEDRPKRVVAKLVDHFRGFAPSDERLTAKGAKLYEAIALSRKGVCRHRSFAFVVTALAAGLPSRFVHNEAHAWVEVFDSHTWHRIDLGGAASDVDIGRPLDVPHVPSPDPLPWPANSESASDMVRSAFDGRGGGGAGQEQPPPTPPVDATGLVDPIPTTTPSVAVTAPPSTAAASEQAPAHQLPSDEPTDPAAELQPAGVDAVRPVLTPPQIDLRTGGAREALRGSRLAVAGRVHVDGAGCGLLRVNVLLQEQAGRAHPVGILVTDADGRFAGEVVVPQTVPVGDYELYVATPGDELCGQATSLESR